MPMDVRPASRLATGPSVWRRRMTVSAGDVDAVAGSDQEVAAHLFAIAALVHNEAREVAAAVNLAAHGCLTRSCATRVSNQAEGLPQLRSG